VSFPIPDLAGEADSRFAGAAPQGAIEHCGARRAINEFRPNDGYLG